MSNVTVLWIVASVLLLIGALCAAGVVRQLIQRQRSKSWPVVSGRITASEVTSEIETEIDDGVRKEKTMYGARIAYTYTVDGATLHGSRVDWIEGVKTNFEGPARRMVDKYPVGQIVNVFYDPRDPSNALLEPWRFKGILLIAVFAVAFGGFGGFLAWIAYHQP